MPYNNMSYNNMRHIKAKGFTLIELMIVVAIIAILATIAFPSYNSAMAKRDRTTAISDINKIAQALERYYSFNRTYSNDFGDLGMAAANTYSISDNKGLYNFSIGVPNTTAITVAPQGADATGASYIIYAELNPNNRDIWHLAQNEIGVQTRYDASYVVTAEWP